MRLMLMVVICLSILWMPFVLKAADNQEEQKGYFETVAIPVKTIPIGFVTYVWAGPDAQDRSGRSFYMFPQDAGSPQLFCLRIDPDTGMCETFYTGTPSKRPSKTTSRSQDNDGWLYGDWDTMEYRFNPRTGALQCLEEVGLKWNFKANRAEKISEQGAKSGQRASPYLPAMLKDLFGLGIVFAQDSTKEAPWRILSVGAAPDGKQWTLRSNTSNTLWMRREDEPFAHLWVYDPVTGEEKDLGVVPERKWYQYPMGPTVGQNGKLYFGLPIAEPDIVVYDPKTGKQKNILPQEYRKFPAWVSNTTDSKGNLYFLLYPQKPGIQPLRTFRVQDDDTLVPIPLKDFPTYDGREGWPYDSAMPTCTLSDGRIVSFITTSGSPGIIEVTDRVLRIQDPKSGKERILHYDYAGVPQSLFGNPVKGPDGKIYGIAEGGHLYRYDPVVGKSEEIGNTVGLYSQVYTTAFSRGKLYTLSYGNGVLGVYDPTKPWRYGKDKDANPRDLGLQGGGGGSRFFDYTIAPDRNIYAVSNPVNGCLGGSLLRIDTETDTTRYWWNEVVRNQMLVSITNDPDKKHLWIGSGPGSVSAYDPEQKEAKLALWDMNEEKKIFECVPIPGMIVIKMLFTAPNDLIYGLGVMGEIKGTQVYPSRSGVMFVFDPKKREVIHQVNIPKPISESGHSLGLGEDGNIYGLLEEEVCMIDPKDNSFKVIAKWPHADLRGGPLVDGKNLYFISGSSLMRYVLPRLDR